MLKLCSVEDCDKPHKGRGYCNTHYGRFYRNGSAKTTSARERNESECSIEECPEVFYSGGLCRKHYDQKRNSARYVPTPAAKCSSVGCSSTKLKSYRPALCERHWQRGVLDDSIVATDGYINKDGYRVVSVLGSKFLEHRLVMERKLKRTLSKTETVHHKNGRRSDNRLSNLELWENSHPYGQRVEDKLEWARNFVSTYSPAIVSNLGMERLDFDELNSSIPFSTGENLHILSAQCFPGVDVSMPGKHQYETVPHGGDAVIVVTDLSVGWEKHKFKHSDLFDDLEAKASTNRAETEMLMRDYMRLLIGLKTKDEALYQSLPGVRPHIFLDTLHVLSVIEHRRYQKWERSFGGRFLFARFANGIVEGLWTAADAAGKQKMGRPGVEWLEKDHGVPTSTKSLRDKLVLDGLVQP